MATFKVGQRVKRARDPFHYLASTTAMPIGATGVVKRIEYDGLVRVVPDDAPEMHWDCEAQSLEPAVDPKADEFIERIKKLKPYDEPLIEKIVRQSVDATEGHE